MSLRRFKPPTMFLVAVVALVIGLEAPAAAQQIKHKIDGSSIAKHSLPANRIKNDSVGGQQLAPLTWHTLHLTNGWAAYPGRRTPAYTVDPFGIVHLQGALACQPSGANCAMAAFTMPSNARPNSTIDIPTYASGVHFGEIYMTSDGSSYFDSSDGNAAASLYSNIDGVSYALK